MKRNKVLNMMADTRSNVSKINLKVTSQGEVSQEQKVVPHAPDDFSFLAQEIKEIKIFISENFQEILQNKITDPRVKEELRGIVTKEVIDRFSHHHFSESRRELLISHIMQLLSEYGPITDIFQTPGVTDVHVNHKGYVTYRKKGILYPSSIRFQSEDEVRDLAERLLKESDGLNTRRVNWSIPIENGMLKDGTRFSIQTSPISQMGTTISLRKHREGFLTREQHLENGTFSEEIDAFLDKVAQSRINLFIVGGGGVGKTEIARYYALKLPEGLRIDQIEDIDELGLHKINPDVRPFIFRRELGEGMKGTAPDILRYGTLRSDVDIAIVGEFLDSLTLVNVLEAMGVGQPGSFTTGHADGPEHILDRAIMLYAEVFPNLTEDFIMRYLANTIELIVTVRRNHKDGSRRISRITQINGVKDKQFMLEDLFRYSPSRKHYRTEAKLNQRLRDKFEYYGQESDQI